MPRKHPKKAPKHPHPPTRQLAVRQPASQPAEPFEQLRTEREAAAILGFSIKTLQKRRAEGRPPSFIKLGDGLRAPVRYADSALRQLIESGRRASTSEGVSRERA